MNQNNEEFLISLSDLLQLFKRSKKQIAFAFIICALLAALYSLTKPVSYVVTGSFREKASSDAGASDSFSTLKIFGLSENSSSEVVAWMQSRTLMEKLIKKFSLQGQIGKVSRSIDTLQRARENLIVEIALWRKQKRPSLPDIRQDILIQDVVYPYEYPLQLTITPLDEKSYEVKEKKKIVGEGRFGEPFKGETFSFTLLAQQPELTRYNLTLWPMWKITEDLLQSIQIKPDLKDKSLFIIKCFNRNRHAACSYVNQLMDLYVEHIRHEHRFLLTAHLDYLQKRQDEMNEKLKSVLEKHVSTLSVDLSSSGFPSSQSVIEFLSETVQRHTKGLYTIEMEISRLKGFQNSGYAYHDRYRSDDDPYTINATLAEIRQLKKQADTIELALKNHPSKQELLSQKEQFKDLIAKHEHLQLYSGEVKELIAQLSGKKLIKKEYQIFHEPLYIAGVWNDRLKEIGSRCYSTDSEEYRSCASQFQMYLNNLDHFFEVYDKTLKERITHQQNPPDEMQGINLSVVQEIYVQYSKMLGDIEANRHQYEYVVQEIKKPSFEISSLSTLIQDPISQDMVKRATEIELTLSDEGNRSFKEQERLRGELAGLRSFLEGHIRQSLELLKIREKLMEEKSHKLQQTTLELIQQQISILEKYLEDFIETRLANLEQEKIFIHQQQKNLQREMADIPGKWVSEKMIDQQILLNQNLMSELTKLVENKNITSNLEVVRSSPVDMAFPPAHPKAPRLFLYTLFGGIMGLFFSCAFFFCRALLTGLEVSADNLRLSKQHVSGQLSHELETLRSLLAYFEASKPGGRDMLLILGEGPNYSDRVATLLSMMGFSVLVLPLSFQKEGEGLLQFLETQVKEPKIHKKGAYDEIEPGGVSLYSSEWVGSHRFQALYEELSKRYDWIICYSSASPLSAEAQALKTKFDRIAITLGREKLHDLLFWMGETEKKISFLMTI